MASITRIKAYRSDQLTRYWNLVTKTLEQVFGGSSQKAKSLRRELNRWPEEERIHFYHSEPLDVAATLAGKRPDREAVEVYQNLARQMKWGLRRQRKKEG